MPVAYAVHEDHLGTCCEEQKPLWLRVVTLDAGIVRRMILGLTTLALIVPLVPGYPGIPCALRALTGIPCPFCGTTTAVGEAARFNFTESLTINPAPLLAGALALILFVLRPARLRVPVLFLFAIPVLMWIMQLQRFS